MWSFPFPAVFKVTMKRVKDIIAVLFGSGGRRAKPDPALDEPAGDLVVDPYDPFPDSVQIEIRDVFDLHSIPPRDVKLVLIEYLHLAHESGFRSVRIIHGKGIGVQRETVRKVLARTAFVLDFGDAPPEAGGWGATIAHLSRK
jgi:hypothetical protein